jgi:hypothetical protein
MLWFYLVRRRDGGEGAAYDVWERIRPLVDVTTPHNSTSIAFIVNSLKLLRMKLLPGISTINCQFIFIPCCFSGNLIWANNEVSGWSRSSLTAPLFAGEREREKEVDSKTPKNAGLEFEWRHLILITLAIHLCFKSGHRTDAVKWLQYK